MTTKAKAKSTETKTKKTKAKKVDGRTLAAKKGQDNVNWNRTKESGGVLTPRQQEIVRLTTLGCTTREIAVLLELSPSTVDNHKAKAMEALGCTKASLLVRVAIAMKLTKPEETLTKAEITKLGGEWKDGWNRK